MSAEGGTGYQHREVIQRSNSPYGPYEPSPMDPVVSNMNAPTSPFQAIGHADLIESPAGWYLVCLGIRPKGGNFQHLGRETFLAPVTWKKDWPRVGDDGVMQAQYALPKLPAHPWPAKGVQDNFDGPTFGLDWNFVRNPHTQDYSLTARPGVLRLNGSAINFTGNDSPAFLCRRQTAFDIDLSVKLAFTPTASNEEAGLVVRGDDKNYYQLVITWADGRRIVRFDKMLKGKLIPVAARPLPNGDIVLRITANALQYQFSAQPQGDPAEQLGIAPTKDLSNEVIGGFTGAFVGLYASGNGKKCVNPADFDWCRYTDETYLSPTQATTPAGR
jgi:xylan 1,4-beta-xylosidase